MITSSLWRGKRYAVLGLARSGQATVRALLASGAEVVAWDSDPQRRHPSESWDPIKDWGISASGGPSFRWDDVCEADLTGFTAVIVSPGVPLNRHPIAAHAAKFGVPIIGDIELFAQARAELPPHKVVGITGTNGKSTTTALVHHILKTAGVPTTMGGNIGLPILGQEPLLGGGVYVLELSSFQIDLTFTLDCDVAVLLNITPDHLDRYDGFEAYAASKARLFEMQRTGATVIVASGEPVDGIRASLEASRPNFEHGWLYPAVEAGVNQPILKWPRPGRVLCAFCPGETQKNEWPTLQGPHNGQNAAGAVEACRLLDLAYSIINQALRTFPGLPHRMERIREKDGVLYVNDSKATNPTSTAPALAAYPAVHWILGGQAKTDELEACAPHFGHVRAAYTIGESAAMFADLLRPHLSVEVSGTLDVAVKNAAANAAAGETVLLSPACASFDQFRDYEDRGDQFRALVGAL